MLPSIALISDAFNQPCSLFDQDNKSLRGLESNFSFCDPTYSFSAKLIHPSIWHKKIGFQSIVSRTGDHVRRCHVVLLLSFMSKTFYNTTEYTVINGIELTFIVKY
ncbi:MAG: hypothetical protein IPO25_22235 [Saprospiraceae bacterium]|nr:hypothetical protein [Saprospiraceae bacterium]